MTQGKFSFAPSSTLRTPLRQRVWLHVEAILGIIWILARILQEFFATKECLKLG